MANQKTNNKKFRNSKRSGKSYNKGGYRDRSVSEGIDGKVGAGNDPGWYAPNDQLLRDAASIPFSYPIGTKLVFGEKDTDVFSVPGIMSIYLKPGIGNSKDASSGVNIASKNIYSYVRHQNSGSKNYESQDLMMYLLAMDSLYTAYSYATRVYGVARLVSQQNRYYPEALLSCMGMNPESVLSNLANLRAAINLFAVKVGAMYVPDSMPYMARHIWCFNNVFKDTAANTAKFQTYIFNPSGFYRFNATKYATGGCLEYFRWHRAGEKLKTAEELITMLNGLMHPIVYDEEMNIMSGDCMKAFGPDKSMKMPMIAEEFVTTPIFDQAALEQITNCVALGTEAWKNILEPNVQSGNASLGNGFSSNDIYQLPNGTIIYHPVVSLVSNEIPTRKWMLNVSVDDATPAVVMEATRLTAAGGTPDASGYVYAFDGSETPSKVLIDFEIGVEHCVGFSVANFANNQDGKWGLSALYVNDQAVFTSYPDFAVKPDDPELATKLVGSLGLYSHISNFDWHPRLFIGFRLLDSAGTAKYQIMPPFGDVHNYTLIDAATLNKMNNIATLGLFRVPLMGVWDGK